MATYLSPGVYVEEVSTGPKPIAGVPTNVAAILGKTEKGPLLEPTRLTDWNGYQSTFGAPMDGSFTAESAFGFFLNGGTALYVVRVDNSTLSRWQVTDAAGANSFVIDAASAGGWSAGMTVSVGWEAGGGKGLLYVGRVTDAGAIALVAGNAKTLSVDTTVGATAGLTVTVADTAGNSADGVISHVGNGTIDVTPGGAANFPANSDIRVFARAANGANQLQLAVGSGFQPGGDDLHNLTPWHRDFHQTNHAFHHGTTPEVQRATGATDYRDFRAGTLFRISALEDGTPASRSAAPKVAIAPDGSRFVADPAGPIWWG